MTLSKSCAPSGGMRRNYTLRQLGCKLCFGEARTTFKTRFAFSSLVPFCCVESLSVDSLSVCELPGVQRETSWSRSRSQNQNVPWSCGPQPWAGSLSISLGEGGTTDLEYLFLSTLALNPKTLKSLLSSSPSHPWPDLLQLCSVLPPLEGAQA